MTMTQSSRGEPKRFHELDSMRGIAALIVVFFHVQQTYFLHNLSRLTTVLIYPFTAGNESVMFFFLLSGFVLSLPYLSGTAKPYHIFIRRRLWRIYAPYLGALAFAVAISAICNRHNVTLHSVLEHVVFIGNYNYYRYNVVFWSLVYEMRISLIFPLLFLVTSIRTRYCLVIVAVLIYVGTPGGQSLATLEYAAVFIVGILIAKNLETISTAYKRLRPWQRPIVLVSASALYLGGHRLSNMHFLWHFSIVPIVIGASGFIVVGLNSATASRALTSGVPSFLGKVSYSLYLTHWPLLFALGYFSNGRVGSALIGSIFVPGAIALHGYSTFRLSAHA